MWAVDRSNTNGTGGGALDVSTRSFGQGPVQGVGEVVGVGLGSEEP